MKGSGDTVQRLELPGNSGYIPANKAADYLPDVDLPDVDFDGYSDIRIFVASGAGANTVDLYYVFDGTTSSRSR